MADHNYLGIVRNLIAQRSAGCTLAQKEIEMTRTLSLLLGLTMVAGLIASPTNAQRNTYKKNYRDNKHVAGVFDYYALVLSWSPTHCATVRTRGYDSQCNPRNGRRFAFVLHGLWPQYNRGYPGHCRIGKRPFVPNSVIDSVQDIMPSRRLTIHEYKKHGTCSGLSPKGYYSVSRRLFESIKIPQRYILPEKAQFVSPQELSDEFLAVNPQLRPDMLAVSCGGAGNRLKEIRICFSKNGKPKPCGHNENQRRMCSAKKMFVPPVRFRNQPRKRQRPKKYHRQHAL
ncbi:MAG: ribonuclease T2 family protein [Hyphomicrobiaceae bacterium]